MAKYFWNRGSRLLSCLTILVSNVWKTSKNFPFSSRCQINAQVKSVQLDGDVTCGNFAMSIENKRIDKTRRRLQTFSITIFFRLFISQIIIVYSGRTWCKKIRNILWWEVWELTDWDGDGYIVLFIGLFMRMGGSNNISAHVSPLYNNFFAEGSCIVLFPRF